MPTTKAKTKTTPKSPKKTKAEADPVQPQQAARDPRSIRIIDTPGISEQFANQVLDVLLVNGSTVAMTLGAKRTYREATYGERETVIAVNARLTLDIPAAEALRNALTRVLAMNKPPQGGLN